MTSGSRPGSHHLGTAAVLPPSLSSCWDMRAFISTVTVFVALGYCTAAHILCVFQMSFFQRRFSVFMGLYEVTEKYVCGHIYI